MVQYCMFEWTKGPIRPDSLHWPWYGSYEGWICQALNLFVNAKEPFSQEESDYAACWKGEIWPQEISKRNRTRRGWGGRKKEMGSTG